MAESETFLELTDVTKTYGGVHALRDVSFRAERGSIHAVLGENGAGKSTLMKVLSGVTAPDSGTIRLRGRTVSFAGPADAAANGVVCIFQELSVIPDLTVAENICLADPPLTRFGFVDRRRQAYIAAEVLERIGCGEGIDVRARCADLPLSKRQLVEIAKAIVRRPNILILDEATSALTSSDVDPVMELLRRLRDEGVCVLFISHRMHEIEALADTCSIFRNGEHVSTFAVGSRSHDEIVRLMIGKPISQIFPDKPVSHPAVAPLLEVEQLHWGRQLNGVSLSLSPGEIVGLGGLDGQGQQELLLAIAGVLRGLRGQVRVAGKSISHRGPQGAKAPGIGMALIPEDRKTQGLFLPLSLRDNLSIALLDRISPFTVIDRALERKTVEEMTATLRIKAENASVAVGTLSGGNQQKVVLAKWLATHPKLLLLMDPARGIDVGTKQEIYRLLRRLAEEGMAILYYSTDYEELIGLCDRALIMYDGRIVASLSGSALNEHNILSSAFDLSRHAGEQPASASAQMLAEVVA
jgi:ribose transport system ATP-binding protein